MGTSPRSSLRDVVLVGGGHSHVQVLRGFAMEPPRNARLTLIVDIPVAVYSGMVPGFVAGQYSAEELEIDVLPLARRARARVIFARAIGIDPDAKQIKVDGRPPVRYDVASFDVGSTVAGTDLPGVRQHAMPTRPIGLFVRRVGALVDRAKSRRAERPLHVVVVGGGAGGVEVAFTLDARLAAEGVRGTETTIVESGSRILRGYADSLARRAERHAAARHIALRCGERVAAAEAERVVLETGESLPCEVLIWVTGAISQPLFRDSGLPTDARGFVSTQSDLRVQGTEGLFAVGDCATLVDYPETPKAGVYAVRQGPYIADNLRAAVEGKPLRRYRPQGDFLTLLNLGDGSAVGAKWGLSFEGRWVMGLKDRIDRRFMRRFQVLDDGGLTDAFAALPAMDDGGEMLCGGCAAKLGRSELERALANLEPQGQDAAVAIGLAEADDATAVKLSDGSLLVSSVDGFRAFTDDPYIVGRVAAVNALSDLYAKAATPRYAQAIVTLPEELSDESRQEMLEQVLAGALAAFGDLGVKLIGGHTTTGPELFVGFHVEGFAARQEELLPLGGLQPDQVLLLTKPLGTGVLFNADMRGRARGPWIEAALDSMLRPNAAAARVATENGATAATDISGFGLAGHLAEMLRAGDVGVALELATLPALPGALDLLDQGLRSTFHPTNAGAARGVVFHPSVRQERAVDLLFDPQTSGGLLFGVAAENATQALERLREGGDPDAAIIGQVTPAQADGSSFRVH